MAAEPAPKRQRTESQESPELVNISARGTSIVVSHAMLLKIPYFEAKLQRWEGEQMTIHLDIQAEQLNPILDYFLYPNTKLRTLIPADVAPEGVYAAAALLSIVPQTDAATLAMHSDVELQEEVARDVRTAERLAAERRMRVCAACGAPYDMENNAPNACACHPRWHYLVRDGWPQCLGCGTYASSGNGRDWRTSFCYQGPHGSSPAHVNTASTSTSGAS